MTHEDDTRDLVRRAGDAVPVSPAPVQDLLHRARGARRRRTMTTLGVVVASVAVITTGAVAVGSQLTGDSSTNPPVSTPTLTSPNNLTPPPGTRLVGRNGIGIAVPKTWGTNQAACHTAFKNTVIVGPNPGVDCGILGPSATSSAILDSYLSVAGDQVDRPQTRVDIDGVSVTRITTYSYPYGGGGAQTFYEGALLNRSLDVSVIVRSPSSLTVSKILGSAFAIPAGYVAVPDDPTDQSLLARGLQVHHETQIRPKLSPGTLLSSSPPQGAVVPRGTLVDILTSRRSCSLVNSSLVIPATRIPLFLRHGPYQVQVEVHVGDVVRLTAIPGCRSFAQFSYATRDLISKPGPRSLTAERTGTVSLSVTQAMCAGTEPRCLGGVFEIALIALRILP